MRIAGLGVPELLLILAVVVLLFGVGRLSKIGSELGRGIREFRVGLKGDDEEAEAESEKETVSEEETTE
jgi:sec-independent protein translocase protein TatA